MSSTPRTKARPKKYLYRIDLLIKEKALKDDKEESEIRTKVQEICFVNDRQFRAIRKAKTGESGYLTTSRLIALAKYFEVSVDALINS